MLYVIFTFLKNLKITIRWISLGRLFSAEGEFRQTHIFLITRFLQLPLLRELYLLLDLKSI